MGEMEKMPRFTMQRRRQWNAEQELSSGLQHSADFAQNRFWMRHVFEHLRKDYRVVVIVRPGNGLKVTLKIMRLFVKSTRHITRLVPVSMKNSRVNALAGARIQDPRIRAKQC